MTTQIMKDETSEAEMPLACCKLGRQRAQKKPVDFLQYVKPEEKVLLDSK